MQGVPTEEQEQQALVKWLKAKKIFHFAPTNENNSHKQDRKYAMIAEQKAKAKGKLKGVSDLVVFLPHEILFIELKRRPRVLKSGKLSVSHTTVSEEQKEFISKTNNYPYAYATVCYGWIEAKELIEEELEKCKQ